MIKSHHQRLLRSFAQWSSINRPNYCNRLFSNPQSPVQTKKNALVIGSSGALGSVVSQYFMQRLGMNVLGADVLPELPSEWTNDSWELTQFCPLPTESGNDVTALTHTLLQAVHQFVHDDDSKRWLDVVVVASGGWEMDPKLSPPSNDINAILENATAYLHTIQQMRQKNFDPVLAASIVAQNYMNRRNRAEVDDPQNDDFNGTLMVVMGATAALQPTPGMLGYGVAKNAAHFVVQTLGSCTGGGSGPTLSRPGGGEVSNLQDSKLIRQAGRKVRHHLPAWDDLTVLGILPTTLDTPSNRRTMLSGTPKEEQAKLLATWIAPEQIAMEIGTWIQTPALRPHSGALIKVIPQPSFDPKSAQSSAKFELVR